jgi:hypothetical protein
VASVDEKQAKEFFTGITTTTTTRRRYGITDMPTVMMI